MAEDAFNARMIESRKAPRDALRLSSRSKRLCRSALLGGASLIIRSDLSAGLHCEYSSISCISAGMSTC